MHTHTYAHTHTHTLTQTHARTHTHTGYELLMYQVSSCIYQYLLVSYLTKSAMMWYMNCLPTNCDNSVVTTLRHFYSALFLYQMRYVLVFPMLGYMLH